MSAWDKPLARITLADGMEFECQLETNPLGIRLWDWTDYRWRPHAFPPPRAEGEVCQLYSTVMWCQDSVGRFRVLPLGYPEALMGRLLIAVPDGRFVATSPHAVFPILDDAAATDGAEDFHSEVMARLLVQPMLL